MWRSFVGGLIGVAMLSACGGPSSAQASPSPSPSASPSPPPLACTANGPASADWPAPDTRTQNGPTPIKSATVSGDTLVLTFDRGTPQFQATPQSSAHFTETNGRGGPVDLKGSAGVLILLRGFRGDMSNYTGQQDFMTSGAVLQEVREIGDYEGVVGWAAGLSSGGCANVTSSGSTLTFTFIKQPA